MNDKLAKADKTEGLAERMQVFKDEETGLPMITVRADVLGPMLVYMRKFFTHQKHVSKNGLSRFMDPQDFEMTIQLQGFTPEDFNALMSLNNTMTTDLAALLDDAVTRVPQMNRSNEFNTLRTKHLPRPASPRPADAPPLELEEDFTAGEVKQLTGGPNASKE